MYKLGIEFGYNVMINKGSIINEDSMVAIKSVVTGKEFPKNIIIGGLPVKVIRENIIWSREKLGF
jgi:acetyltransferase-like isoleucine patch superfamily enzyme